MRRQEIFEDYILQTREFLSFGLVVKKVQLKVFH